MIIYVITNQINNKKYIGLTRQSLEKRWRTHLKDWRYKEGRTKPLYLAIKKYGPENFTIEVIKKYSSKEKLLELDFLHKGILHHRT